MFILQNIDIAPDFNSEKQNSEDDKCGVGDQDITLQHLADQDISTNKVCDRENVRSCRYNLRSRVANTAVS